MNPKGKKIITHVEEDFIYMNAKGKAANKIWNEIHKNKQLHKDQELPIPF